MNENLKDTKLFFPLRIALGLMFLSAGIGKLTTLMVGSLVVPEFFASLGIPFPEFFAWVVAIAETIGGVFLVIGLLTWWSSFILANIMVVAGFLTGVIPISDFEIGRILEHAVYITALLAIMWSKNTYLAIDEKIGWKQPY